MSRLEAAGGVEHWSAKAGADETLREALARATEEQRALRRELAAGRTGQDGGASLELGIGGTQAPEQLKCLHAHVAFALAHHGYELGEKILAEVDPRWPAVCCSDSAPEA